MLHVLSDKHNIWLQPTTKSKYPNILTKSATCSMLDIRCHPYLSLSYVIYTKEFFVLIYYPCCSLGLGFRPSPPEENIDSTLIWFNASRPETVDYWVENLNKFLERKY